jgi:PAS domain S-box-containing protein
MPAVSPMPHPFAHSRIVRAVLVTLVAGSASAPLSLRAAGGEATPAMGAFDLGLIVGVGLAVGLVTWLWNRVTQRRLARHTASRINQMTALIEHAECLLWEADVELKPDDWRWRMKLHDSAFCRKLFQGRPQIPGTDLWIQFAIDDREALNRRAREAMAGGQSGYKQQFRAVRDGQVHWLQENVSITAVGRNRFWLVGLVTDITAQRAAEEARQQSELTVDRILAHAQCLLWRATVVRQDGVLHWPRFDIPQSQFSDLLFGQRVYSPNRGFWDTLTVPEQAEMDERSTRAILNGAPGYAQQFRAINREGRLFWLNERVSITRLSDQSWSLVGVLTDVTAQQEAEEARRKSELHLSHLLERADTMLWQAQVRRRPDGRFDWVILVPKSQLYRRIFSSDPQNPVGFAWKENDVPEHEEMALRSVRALVEGAPGYEQVFHVPRPEGTIWLSETVTVVSTGPDTWDLVGIISDITARHQAEEAWQDSQARLGQLLEMADCMVWEATVKQLPDDNLDWDQYIPPSALYRRIFGDPVDGKARLSWELKIIPEFPEMVARTLAAVKAGAPGYTQEFHVQQSGGDLWLRETVTIVPLGPGLYRMVGVITDITAQHRAEEAHQKSEVRLAALLERADCMIWQGECRRRGPEDFVWQVFTPRSQLYHRIFGHDPDGACHFAWQDAVPEFPEMRTRGRQALVEGWPGYEQVFHYQHAQGDIWLNEKVSIRPVGPEQWELTGIITDITAQRKSESARVASEQRLGELMARADCLLWESTVELKATSWIWDRSIQPSLLYRRLTGSPLPESTEAMWPLERVPERPEMDRRCREALLAGRKGYDHVFHFIRKDGEVVWVSENVTIHRLAAERYWLVGVAVDITAQRQAEEALAAEKERLSVTLRAMHESVITTDKEGLIQFMNPAAAELTGYAIEQCVGRPVDEICRLEHSRSEEGVPVPFARVARGDLVADLPAQTRLVAQSGRRRQVEGCCAPIHAVDSKVIGTVLVLRDVTEQERLEQELVRATRLESVGVLAGGIAHDFNNILTAVMGNLALAQLDIPPGTPAGTSLRLAEKAALRARDLTQQLLTFAKGGEPVRAAVQLDAIVREMAAFALHGSQIKAHYDMAPDLWPADADKGQIGRVVQNLVINAVQAMPHGGRLQIVARNDALDSLSQPGLAPGDYIQIAIADTGEGINPEHLTRIFDPYFTTKQSGTGLGLAAVYSIVKKHRGHIEVDSQPGQGTTFRIWLPAVRDRPAGAETRAPMTAGVPERLKGRVLFMDDEPSIRAMAMDLLQRFGLTVVCAADGAEAVEKFQTARAAGSPFDLVIMDLTVPGGMGGLSALGHLRKIDPAVKAVVSSGYSSDPVMANYRTHGFVAMMAKPYEVHDISRVLREVLAGA